MFQRTSEFFFLKLFLPHYYLNITFFLCSTCFGAYFLLQLWIPTFSPLYNIIWTFVRCILRFSSYFYSSWSVSPSLSAPPGSPLWCPSWSPCFDHKPWKDAGLETRLALLQIWERKWTKMSSNTLKTFYFHFNFSQLFFISLHTWIPHD